MSTILLVGVGGFVGSVLRYLISASIQQYSTFPIGTLAVNLAGCFIIGFLSQLSEARGVFTPESRLLVFIGVLGGFTTFSTFSNDTMDLLRDGAWISGALNASIQLLLGLSAVWLGRVCANLIWQ